MTINLNLRWEGMEDEGFQLFARENEAFKFIAIDDFPQLLEESYRLRYNCYCHERAFLDPKKYSHGLEIDEFDSYSTHFGLVDETGALAGTVRLVHKNPLDYPMFSHCSLYPKAVEVLRNFRMAEVSRLVISPEYRRRIRDSFFGAEPTPLTADEQQSAERRITFPPILKIFMGLADYKNTYGLDLTHMLFTTDLAIIRIIRHFKEAFYQIGPKTDYYGPVIPCLVNNTAFEKVLRQRFLPPKS